MKSRKFDVVIIGGYGHVGLPFGIMLAKAGLEVGLCDLNSSVEKVIRSGKMPFMERGAESILKKVIGKTLHVGVQHTEMHGAIVVIAIGTPVNERFHPDLKPMFKLIRDIRGSLHEGQHVMLRSTVYPGTTRKIYQMLNKRGKNIHLSFCPERIVQGHAIEELGKFPQIISGVTKQALSSARKTFSYILRNVFRI